MTVSIFVQTSAWAAEKAFIFTANGFITRLRFDTWEANIAVKSLGSLGSRTLQEMRDMLFVVTGQSGSKEVRE